MIFLAPVLPIFAAALLQRQWASGCAGASLPAGANSPQLDLPYIQLKHISEDFLLYLKTYLIAYLKLFQYFWKTTTDM